MEWWQIALLGLGILAALLVFAACWTGKMADKLSADYAAQRLADREQNK
jgi:hypothetical protein